LQVAFLSEADEYDEIFAALKHPVRRQILLFLEQKSEASFTALQKAVDTNDTGLLSYHLKELAPLVEQSKRGTYRLSETGQAAVAFFQKVENEKNLTSKAVGKEFEKWIGKIFFLVFIVGISLIAPLSADIYVLVQTVGALSLSVEHIVGMFLIGLFGMIFGAVLFVFYDRHYFSKLVRTNLLHSESFALFLALASILTTYAFAAFQAATLATSSDTMSQNVIWSIGAARIGVFLCVTPLLTYAIVKIPRKFE
jgi:DNA-binding transcriptional ArsR family regulator